ncbi:ribbon-helix-helix protein, CopG family [Chryseobacterium koreense]|uniref:ribbon-helix-helix protein, CopG family n=1 Tax=Chryseobacterium koreense TaxID=232216 RepID=UPI0026EF8755|nr:ribbon-helix-helix protein, CopG family [Chryseobacterium koreense]
MIQEKKLTSIRLNRELYKALQKRAKEENRSVNNFIETTLFDVLYREPNEETLAAMDEAINHPEKLEQITNIDAFLEKVRDGEI